MSSSRQVMSVRDVASELDVSVWTIRIWVKEGKLPAFRFGKLYKVSREALNDFKQDARVRASAA